MKICVMIYVREWNWATGRAADAGGRGDACGAVAACFPQGQEERMVARWKSISICNTIN